MAASTTPPATLREGRGYELWALALVFALSLALLLVVHDLRGPARTPWVWWTYLVVQILNKAPIAYRYALRGPLVAVDLAGFSLGCAGVACLASGVELDAGLHRALFAATLAYQTFGVAWELRAHPDAPPFDRRLYCAIVAYWIPALPMALAWLL
jgi:hypothetical protein